MSEPVIRVHGLSRQFGKQKALDDVGIEVQPGIVFGLMAALAHRPQLLVLDEASSGLDPAVRRDILGAIIRTVADEGRNVLFSSHLLDEVQRVADEVAMLHQGRIVMCDTLDRILGSHHRLTIRFAQPQTEAPDLPGSGCWSGARHEWTTVCNGELERLQQAVAAVDAQIVEHDQPSLEEVFINRIGRPSQLSSKSE